MQGGKYYRQYFAYFLQRGIEMDKKKGKTANFSFEEALSALESIIKKMEREELPLEESLKYFEQGMELNARCRKLLTEAELRVEKLLESGEWVESDEHL